MKIPINKPFFLNNSGCPTSNNTDFFAILIQKPFDNSLFETIFDQILNQSSPLCRDNVSASFVEESLEKCNYLLVIYYYNLKQPINQYTITQSPNSIPYAFATCIDKRLTTNNIDNSIYVDVICSNLLGNLNSLSPKPPQGGKTALNILSRFGKENNYKYISLSALVSVINYYRKLGFRHINYGQTVEPTEINQLADLNKDVKFDDIDDAKQRIKVERAYQLSMETGKKDKPVFDENKFAKILKQSLNLDDLPEEDEIMDYLAELDEHVSDNNGRGGFYDLVSLLIRNGFGNKDTCSGITPRNLLQFDEDSNLFFIACIGDGFNMRKPLSRKNEHSFDIIKCQTNNTNSNNTNVSRSNSINSTRKRKRSVSSSSNKSTNNTNRGNSSKSRRKRTRRSNSLKN